MSRNSHILRTATVVAAVTFFAATVTVPSTASAVNPTVVDLIERAMAERRYTDALGLISEMERLNGPTLDVLWSRAQALVLSGRNAEADAAAAACFESSGHSTAAFARTAREDCLRIRERAQASIRAAVPVAPAPTPPVVVPAEPPRVTVRTVPVTTLRRRDYSPPTPAVVLLSVGAASLATAGVLGAMASSAVSGCTVTNGVATCPTQGELTRAQSSQEYATGANVALGIGSAAVVAGGIAWAVGVALRSPTHVTVAVTTDSIVVGGRF
jgi:hypothetical protein